MRDINGSRITHHFPGPNAAGTTSHLNRVGLFRPSVSRRFLSASILAAPRVTMARKEYLVAVLAVSSGSAPTDFGRRMPVGVHGKAIDNRNGFESRLGQPRISRQHLSPSSSSDPVRGLMFIVPQADRGANPVGVQCQRGEPWSVGRRQYLKRAIS